MGQISNRCISGSQGKVGYGGTYCRPDRRPDAELFVVQTDAGEYASGGILLQASRPDGPLHPICFLSQVFNPAQCKYPTPQKEVLAILIGLKALQTYIYARRFTLQTDSQTALGMIKNPTSTPDMLTARWIMFIAGYDFDLEYMDRRMNVLADSLTRREHLEEEEDISDDEEFLD